MKKTNYGMFQAMSLCSKYSKYDKEARQALQEKRLRQMVLWARENSPYYSKLYENIKENFVLSNLPSVNKVDLMANWNDWVTDRSINLDQVNDFMKNSDNIGRKFDKKYLVFTTSGSTGNPLFALCDKTTNNVFGAISAKRSFARKTEMKSFIKHGGKTIGVFATGGFYLGNSSVRSRLLMMPWKKHQMAVTSALLPLDTIVAQLNEFKPAMLGGYPSNLELLIDKQKSGELHIAPVIIMTGGEYLSDKLRAALAETFHCYVQTSYSCTEGGTMACECPAQHFHVNDDWLIIEPVDKNNNPVPDGVQSDKILLTNLFNFTQPFIRYEVTDRVVMHHEPCSCGNPSPWLTLEGRTDDVVTFNQGGKNIRLAPLAIYAVLKEVHEIKRFQMIAHKEDSVELRLISKDGVTREAAFMKAKDALTKHFALHGVTNISYELLNEEPMQDAGSGKFKHIIMKK